MNYTVRIVMRGEGKAYKGKKFKGSVINLRNNLILKTQKSILGGNDRRNGDNESSGPIFDLYYIPLESNFGMENFNDLINSMFPKMKKQKPQTKKAPIGKELKVTRYTSTGSSWHINTDGKQVEAIAFKASQRI